jgi:rhodanese-related sulfurtransferase
VASWLRQMGHDAAVLSEGLATRLRWPQPQADVLSALPELAPIDAAALAQALAQGAVEVVELRPGMAYRQAHIAGTHWGIRPRLPGQARALARSGRPLVLVADEPGLARAAAIDLQAAGLALPRLLAGGLAAWRAAGLPSVASPQIPGDADCIDYLFFVHDRHDGNKDAARRYLAWETGLMAQLGPQDSAAWRIA